MAEREIDPRDLRRAFGAFATGVTIITTSDAKGAPWGFTANSFTSVSLDPPLALVCLAKTAGSFSVFEKTERFAINILSEQQRDASVAFASWGADKFSAVNWGVKATGSPVLDGVVAWLDCATHELVDAGDHIVLIGRVVDYDYNAEPPLGYCRGAYVSFGLSQEVLKASEQEGKVLVGAIVEHKGAILVDQDPKSGAIRLPSAAKLGEPSDPKGLFGRLAAEGVSVRLPFVFAVYDRDDTHCIYYRGQVMEIAKEMENRFASHCFIDFDELPWERIDEPAVRMMLERYIQEREADQFGVYVGDSQKGDVRHLK
ncbi:MAG: flavin reductase family protein [Pseudomonadota bacterium]